MTASLPGTFAGLHYVLNSLAVLRTIEHTANTASTLSPPVRSVVELQSTGTTEYCCSTRASCCRAAFQGAALIVSGQKVLLLAHCFDSIPFAREQAVLCRHREPSSPVFGGIEREVTHIHRGDTGTLWDDGGTHDGEEGALFGGEEGQDSHHLSLYEGDLQPQGDRESCFEARCYGPDRQGKFDEAE